MLIWCSEFSDVKSIWVCKLAKLRLELFLIVFIIRNISDNVYIYFEAQKLRATEWRTRDRTGVVIISITLLRTGGAKHSIFDRLTFVAVGLSNCRK